MTGRATTQAIAANDLNEGDSDAVRIRHQLDAWANASPRTPRLVATPAEDLGVEGKAPVAAAKKRSRAVAAAGRTKATRATKAVKAKGTEATRRLISEAGLRPLSSRSRPTRRRSKRRPISVAPTVPEAGCSRAGARAHQPCLCPCLPPSRWRALLPIFQSQAWPKYFPAIRLR